MRPDCHSVKPGTANSSPSVALSLPATEGSCRSSPHGAAMQGCTLPFPRYNRTTQQTNFMPGKRGCAVCLDSFGVPPGPARQDRGRRPQTMRVSSLRTSTKRHPVRVLRTSRSAGLPERLRPSPGPGRSTETTGLGLHKCPSLCSTAPPSERYSNSDLETYAGVLPRWMLEPNTISAFATNEVGPCATRTAGSPSAAVCPGASPPGEQHRCRKATR